MNCIGGFLHKYKFKLILWHIIIYVQQKTEDIVVEP